MWPKDFPTAPGLARASHCHRVYLFAIYARRELIAEPLSTSDFGRLLLKYHKAIKNE
jgi:hypothetical protein